MATCTSSISSTKIESHWALGSLQIRAKYSNFEYSPTIECHRALGGPSRLQSARWSFLVPTDDRMPSDRSSTGPPGSSLPDGNFECSPTIECHLGGPDVSTSGFRHVPLSTLICFPPTVECHWALGSSREHLSTLSAAWESSNATGPLYGTSRG